MGKHFPGTKQIDSIYPMENRIDMTQFERLEEIESTKISQWRMEGYTDKEIEQLRDNSSLEDKLPALIAELKKMYAKEDALIAEAKDLVYYDLEDEMWRYDESKSGNPGLDAMDFVAEISTMNE